MTPKPRRRLDSSFEVSAPRPGTWLLSGAQGAAIYALGARAPAAPPDPSVRAVEIEWREGGARLTLEGPTGSVLLEARNVIVHEPLATLYRQLPLIEFDGTARRFWRRVFALVRIPGGRHLLNLIARRTRAPT